MLEGTKTNIDDKAKLRVIVGRKATGPKFRDRQVAGDGIILCGRCSILKRALFFKSSASSDGGIQMETLLECSFYRHSKNIYNGRGPGLCNLDGDQTICNGDLNYCGRPSTLSKSQSEQNWKEDDRRKHPRVDMDLPLEYRVTGVPNAHGALIVNGSEMGLLMESGKHIPVGTNLNIAVLFPKGYEMANLEVSAQIIWKEIYWKEDWEGYQYGLKFVSIRRNDHWKLRQLLSGRYNLDEITSDL